MDKYRRDRDDEATKRLNERIDKFVNGPINVDEARELDILRSASFEPVFDPNFKKEDKKGDADA